MLSWVHLKIDILSATFPSMLFFQNSRATLYYYPRACNRSSRLSGRWNSSPKVGEYRFWFYFFVPLHGCRNLLSMCEGLHVQMNFTCFYLTPRDRSTGLRLFFAFRKLLRAWLWTLVKTGYYWKLGPMSIFSTFFSHLILFKRKLVLNSTEKRR